MRKIKVEDCPSYEGCEAPLCPLDTNSLPHAIWYVDEPVCPSLKYRQHFVLMQKKIVKHRAKASKQNDIGYFTVKMLNSIKSVSPNIKGIVPESKQTPNGWIRKRTTQRRGAP